MKKRILSIITSLAMVLSVLAIPVNVQAEELGGEEPTDPIVTYEEVTPTEPTLKYEISYDNAEDCTQGQFGDAGWWFNHEKLVVDFSKTSLHIKITDAVVKKSKIDPNDEDKIITTFEPVEISNITCSFANDKGSFEVVNNEGVFTIPIKFLQQHSQENVENIALSLPGVTNMYQSPTFDVDVSGIESAELGIDTVNLENKTYEDASNNSIAIDENGIAWFKDEEASGNPYSVEYTIDASGTCTGKKVKLSTKKAVMYFAYDSEQDTLTWVETSTGEAPSYITSTTVFEIAKNPTLVLDKPTMSLEVGNTGALIATATDIEGGITWESSDPTIATVDENGGVTAVAVGEATITAKAGGEEATCTVTVTEPTGPKPVLEYGMSYDGAEYTSDKFGYTISTNNTATFTGQDLEVDFNEDYIYFTITKYVAAPDPLWDNKWVTPEPGEVICAVSNEVTKDAFKSAEYNVENDGSGKFKIPTKILKQPGSRITFSAVGSRGNLVGNGTFTITNAGTTVDPELAAVDLTGQTYQDKDGNTISIGSDGKVSYSDDPTINVAGANYYHVYNKVDKDGNYNTVDEISLRRNGGRDYFFTYDEANSVLTYKSTIDIDFANDKQGVRLPYLTAGAAFNRIFAVDGITLDQTAATLEIGKTLQLNATVTPANATDKTVTWTTSNDKVATVKDGLVTAVAAGEATITAKAGEKTATCTVTVKKAVDPTVAVDGITLDKASATLEISKTLQLKAAVTPANATDKTVTWTTSNDKVATVKDGKVTAVAAGTATITAKAGEKTATCTVTVKKPADPTVAVEGITLDKTSATLEINKTLQLKAAVTPANATDKTVTWTTSNDKVASVKDGKVTAVAAGEATITAKAGEKTATCTVTVKISLNSISLNTDEVTLDEFGKVNLTVSCQPDNTTDSKTASWSTSDAEVATVDNGKVTAVKPGTAIITANVSGKTASCKVTVKEVIVDFPDTSEDAWFYESVKWAKAKGVMLGLEDGRFAPADDLERGQFATILYRSEGSPAIEFSEEFPDVPDGMFFSKPIVWARKNGIVSGYENGTFGPSNKMNREELATMMYRYAKMKGCDISLRADLSSFPDSDKVSAYAKEAVEWAVAFGLISGDQGKINPQGTASRAVTATIMMRFDSKN